MPTLESITPIEVHDCGGRKVVTFRFVWRNAERSLTGDEVNEAMEAIKRQLRADGMEAK